MTLSSPTMPGNVIAQWHNDPDWWRTAVVYQIYPRSFADSDGDGVGDIPGVISRMDYLAALGIDALWLSPFYPSPLADGGYDVADYRNVDPLLGTLKDFDEMVAAAHQRQIRIVIDLVPNHTSEQHVWFQEALASPKGSTLRDRYVFRPGKGADGTEPPTDWQSHFGGSAWTPVGDGDFYLHLFAREQPDLNWDNPEVREDFLRTLRFWGDRGVDGFRVDVAHSLAKDLTDPLKDRAGAMHPQVTDGTDPLFDRDEVHEIYRSWRTVFNEYDPPLSAVAETWHPITDRVYLYARPDELGQVFDFSLLKCAWSRDQYLATIRRSLEGFSTIGGGMTWVLSNHDVPRHAARLGLPVDVHPDDWLALNGTSPVVDVVQGLRRARAATLMMLALPGAAYIYQGEELGLPEVVDLKPDELCDPVWERSGHTLKGRDGCRVPLPWVADSPTFGFTTSSNGMTPQPWLPQPSWFSHYAVDAEDGVPGSTLELYREALAARKKFEVGENIEWLSLDDPAVIHFRRPGGVECITNFGAHPVPIPEGDVLVVSGDVVDGKLPTEATAWVQVNQS